MIKRASDILRFEIQCKSPKVGYLRRQKGFESRKLKHFFSPEIAESVLVNHCRRVYKTGDYYTINAAVAHMKRLGVSKRRIAAFERVLRSIAQARSISEARRQLQETGLVLKNTNPPLELRYSTEQFCRNCKALAEMNINPVVIPREWKINHLPSILSLIRITITMDREPNVNRTA